MRYWKGFPKWIRTKLMLANSMGSFLIVVRIPNNLRATAAENRVAPRVRTGNREEERWTHKRRSLTFEQGS